MIQCLTMIPGFPKTMQNITAVSDIIDLNHNNEAVLCFTITFQDGTFLNVSKPYTPDNRGFRYMEIKLLHSHLLEYLDIGEKPNHRFIMESGARHQEKE